MPAHFLCTFYVLCPLFARVAHVARLLTATCVSLKMNTLLVLALALLGQGQVWFSYTPYSLANSYTVA